MPEWIIWAVGIWFFLNVMGRRGCAWGPRHTHHLRHARTHRMGPGNGSTTTRTLPRSRIGSPSSQEKPRRERAEPAETPEERIRLRFVEGVTTLDEYETELWEELRPK